MFNYRAMVEQLQPALDALGDVRGLDFSVTDGGVLATIKVFLPSEQAIEFDAVPYEGAEFDTVSFPKLHIEETAEKTDDPTAATGPQVTIKKRFAIRKPVASTDIHAMLEGDKDL